MLHNEAIEKIYKFEICQAQIASEIIYYTMQLDKDIVGQRQK
jgi:hypothetical protein